MRIRRASLGRLLLCLVTTLRLQQAAAEEWTQWRNTLAPRGEAAAALPLATNGQTDYVIVIPAKPTTQDTKAATDLAHWLKAMTGATFNVVADDRPAGPHEISVGRTNRLAGLRSLPDADGLGEEGYAVAVDGDRPILIGGSTRGAINAVYALLEEDLGCRWYAADADRIPPAATLRLRCVPRVSTPALRIRDPFYRVAFDATWSLRNRTNAPNAAVPEQWGGHVDYALFVHTVHSLVPPATYFKDHPEYFMLDASGKRNPHQLCMTNPDVIRIATESVLRIMKDRPHCEIISVSKTDGGRTCLCERCKTLDQAEGSDAASLLYMVNRVAEAVEKVHPKLIISTLAYLETVKPPKTIRPRRNVAIRLCTDRCMWAHPFTPAEDSPVFSEAMINWSKIHSRIHIWDYCVNFSHYPAPMPNMDVVAKNIRYFVAHHATGVMEQAAYQSPGGERDLMRSWVMAKLMWDPSRDVRALMLDFIWGYYGQAAPLIAEYEGLLRTSADQHLEFMKAPKGGIRYPMDSPFLSKDFLDKANVLFDRAERLAESDEIRLRVEQARMPVMYVMLCRGPDFVGAGYAALVDRFERIARRVKVTHLREGSPDLDEKLAAWRKLAAGK
jgi:hypothetical protein